MGFVKRVLDSLSTGFVGLCICLGFWADIPVPKDKLENAVSTTIPLGAALLPWLVLGATVLFAVHTARVCFAWVTDRLRDGPSVRKFKALAPRTRHCREILVRYCDARSCGEGEHAFQYSQANVEVRQLLDELTGLGIPTRPFDKVQERERLPFFISYFTGMESLATNGNLRHARDGTMHQRYHPGESE